MKFSIKDFFSKCEQIPSFLRTWSHLLEKSFMENFIFCAECDKHAPANEFLGSFSSHMFLRHMFQPTRISTSSKTIIDNIFSNIHTPSSISSNPTASFSDHLPQFLIVPNIFLNLLSPTSNIYERD